MSAIRVYVDESYLHRHTGLIQVAIPIPADNEYAIAEAISDLDSIFPNLVRDEFKASSITKGNLPIFERFLCYVINACAAIGDQSELRPIVVFEGFERHSGSNSQWIADQVKGSFEDFGIRDSDNLTTEFGEQVWWFYRFMERICEKPIRNEFEIVLDNKYRYAQESMQDRLVIVPDSRELHQQKMSKFLTSYTNTLLAKLEPRKQWFPKISSFSFGFSHKNLMLQAADILANLFLNEARYVLGARTATVELKHELLSGVMEHLSFPSDFSSAFALFGNDCECTDPNFGGVIQLDPVPLTP